MACLKLALEVGVAAWICLVYNWHWKWRSSLCGMYGVILSGCGSKPVYVCSDVLFTTVAFKVGVAAVCAMITLMGVACMMNSHIQA